MVSSDGVEIKNYMEDIVSNMIDEVLKNINACTCTNCKSDIFAITLNTLPSKYVATLRGELYAKVNNLHQQYDVDTISAITKAAAIVARNPRH